MVNTWNPALGSPALWKAGRLSSINFSRFCIFLKILSTGCRQEQLTWIATQHVSVPFQIARRQRLRNLKKRKTCWVATDANYTYPPARWQNWMAGNKEETLRGRGKDKYVFAMWRMPLVSSPIKTSVVTPLIVAWSQRRLKVLFLGGGEGDKFQFISFHTTS